MTLIALLSSTCFPFRLVSPSNFSQILGPQLFGSSIKLVPLSFINDAPHLIVSNDFVFYQILLLLSARRTQEEATDRSPGVAGRPDGKLESKTIRTEGSNGKTRDSE